MLRPLKKKGLRVKMAPMDRLRDDLAGTGG